ncbi:hypothetical protein DFH07DRAFT_969382 [Mycena maculata]|uniref:Uncharacterized protein n=1 Tax=Mycena maculata TaxID=230809 RepID=A0AAD7HXI1_9AGAR|nr:hypothetical protein DFH07DRAFT_969382 [Mycena maculata]
MPTQSGSPSPPSSPSATVNLTQKLTPTKTPRRIQKIRRDLQVQANEARAENLVLKRRFADAESQNTGNKKQRKLRKRGDRARDAPDSHADASLTEDKTREAGRLFAIQKALFLIDEEVMSLEEDENFDFSREFETHDLEIQGQFQDILHILPVDARPARKELWIQGAFIDGLHGQRSSFRNRLRTQALSHIVDDIKPFATGTSAGRFEAFSAFIGYKFPTEDTDAFYDHFEVPVLYDKWEGTVDLDHLFRGPILLKIYVSLIRGPEGAVGLFQGLSKLPKARCLERLHHITHTTPGAIANAAILAIWLYSADTQLVRIASSYSDEPHAMCNQHAEDDEDLNDIFDNAPSVSVIPTSTLQLAIPVTSLHTDSSSPTICRPHASGRSAPPAPASTPSGLEFTAPASAATFVH